jgi:hypothetical protein
MDSKQKQRAVIEFLTNEVCRLSDIHRRLLNVYGDDTIDRSNVHRWMKKFKEGETSIWRQTTQWETINCDHWHESSASGRIDLHGKMSHTLWACFTTGLWSQCCEEVNNGANASLVKETVLSSTFVWRKSYSSNMCNLNDLCQLTKKLCPLSHYFQYPSSYLSNTKGCC